MKPVHLQDQIYERLLESIRAGEYRPGERLPSMPTLAEKFNVSVSPVRLAILKLDRNGFVSSRHGSGTYVVDPFERFNDRDSVCVCLEHDAHLTSELYLSLTHAFQGMGKFCFGLNPKEPNFPPLLERALNSEAQVFIFFGDQYFPFRLLRPELAKGKTLISVLKAVEPQTTELGASAVLVDIHCGVELAIDHLRRLGHRHLLVVGTNTMIAESFSKYKTDRSELLVNVRGNKDLKFTPLVSRVPESERLCFDEPALLGLLDSPRPPPCSSCWRGAAPTCWRLWTWWASPTPPTASSPPTPSPASTSTSRKSPPRFAASPRRPSGSASSPSGSTWSPRSPSGAAERGMGHPYKKVP